MGRVQKGYEERRNELLTAALSLFVERGYNNTAVNDILNRVGVSKGTFYHYFKSKEELLDAIVGNLTDLIMTAIQGVVTDETLDSMEKMNRVMAVSRGIKADNADVVKAIINISVMEDNLVIRHKMRERNREMMVPLYEGIIRQGIEEGTMEIPYPHEAAVLLAGMFLETGDRNTHLIAGLRLHPENVNEVVNNFKLLETAVTRILGMRPGSVVLADESFIRTFSVNLQNAKEA